MPEQSLLDARLAEIDRRLRAIQTGLRPPEEPGGAVPPATEPERVETKRVETERVEPERIEPGSGESAHAEPTSAEQQPAAPDAPAAELTPNLVGELHALAEAHERLLELHRELLSEYASLLERRIADQPPPPAAP